MFVYLYIIAFTEVQDERYEHLAHQAVLVNVLANTCFFTHVATKRGASSPVNTS